MKLSNLFGLALIALALGACGGRDSGSEPLPSGEEIAVTEAELANNPFMEEWTTPYGVPPFASIENGHYMPAIKKGILELRAEIADIATNPEAPTFDNTILALETSGETLDRVRSTFGNITGTELDDELRALQTEIYPMLTREYDAITLNGPLFDRIRRVYEQSDSLGLDEQDARLLELRHRSFVRAGAALAPDVKDKVAEINAQISSATTEFGQNLLAATKAFKLELTDEAQTAGLSPDFKASIWDDDAGAWVVGLNRSAYETFMTQSENRELREQLFNGYRLRASEGEYDNGPIAIKIAQLRAQRAELMGYASHAHYQLETRMAKTPKGAEDFLLRVWRPGLERAKEERADMQAMIGDEFKFAAHDWWHYAEKVRKARFDLDENETKPYFDLERVRSGAFEMATRLFGLTFKPVDVDGWNAVVTSYDVMDADGTHLGLFMTDMYARDSKRGGAWMSTYRNASNIAGKTIRPIVTNNLNLSTPPEGEPTLMRFSEVETLFHEFGHGLHGLMTKIDYPMFSGVDGPRDYTEFPAQILEHWTAEPEMLAIYARHYASGDVIPAELVERMRVASNFNQGFTTTEYVAASLLDLRWHMLTPEEAAAITDARSFETKVLDEYGLIDEIEPRYRSQYFSHIFAGGYSAGYYAYLWSEILDADGFAAFKQAEDIFDPETAARLKKWVYQSGGLREADELYRNFRGRDPSIEPLLEGRGFAVEEAGGGT
ncbi:MAG: M3 family metallopeptidase [Gammaproteobacteria bacterium]|nr:M3 family metallopeptidase [Gammaproteobacteria bacterium]NNL49167.1 M3 family metallopeptidase [Woeseiaceae bacterium]